MEEDLEDSDQEGGYDTPEEAEEEDQAGQEAAPQQAGAMLPLPVQQLPVLPKPQQLEHQAKGKDNPAKDKGPQPPLQLPLAMEMPPGAQHAPQDFVPPPIVQPPSPHHHQAHAASKDEAGNLQLAKNPFLGLLEDPKAKGDRKPLKKTVGEARNVQGPASPQPGGSASGSTSPGQTPTKPTNVRLMAELIGLSPSEITKKARTDLVGDLVRQSLSPPMQDVARGRLQPHSSDRPLDMGRPHPIHRTEEGESTPPREASPEPTKPGPNRPFLEATPQTRTKMHNQKMEELAKILHDSKQRQEELHAKLSQPKSTRSAYKAPDIPHTPAVSLERQLKKQQKEKEDKQKLEKQKSSSDSELD